MSKRSASAWVILALAGAFLMPAHARDSGQWDKEDPAISQWYRSLMQPDNPGASCCGDADAYWADEVEFRGDKVIATITDPRPDEPLRRRHIPIGKKYEVPRNKITYRDGNPTGHVIIFINWNDDVLCYVMNGGV